MRVLTTEQIEQIKREYESGKTDMELAMKYFVHYKTIQYHVKGIKWTRVKGELR